MEKEKTKEKKKRKSYTMQEKLKWIEEASKPGMSQVHVAKKFSITPSVLHGILAKKEKIIDMTGGTKKTKRMSQGLVKDLEDKLYAWFLKKRSQGLIMDRPLQRKQAEKMAKEMGLEDKLTFSAGWLWRWRCCYGVVFKMQHGEQQDVDFEASKRWLEEVLLGLLEEFTPDNIFNSDKTSIYYRGMSNKGLVGRHEKPSGAKLAKEHLTALVTTNMTGSKKPKLLIIGRSARPRGFPRDMSVLPVHYELSAKVWMTGLL